MAKDKKKKKDKKEKKEKKRDSSDEEEEEEFDDIQSEEAPRGMMEKDEAADDDDADAPDVKDGEEGEETGGGGGDDDDDDDDDVDAAREKKKAKKARKAKREKKDSNKGNKGKKAKQQDGDLIFGIEKFVFFQYVGGFFIMLVVLGVVLWHLLRPRIPEVVTICQFKFCDIIGKKVGPECADELERIAVNGTGIIVAESALKFFNPNKVTVTGESWKIQLNWAANARGNSVTMIYCSGKNTEVKAESDSYVPFSCTLNAQETAFPAMIEAYWQNAVLGIDTIVDLSLNVAGITTQDIHYEHQTTLNRGENGGTDETLIFGPDGVLDGWDGELAGLSNSHHA